MGRFPECEGFLVTYKTGYMQVKYLTCAQGKSERITFKVYIVVIYIAIISTIGAFHLVRTHKGGGGGGQASYTFPLHITCKKGVGWSS